MSKSFADAASRKGAVLFIDELDAIGDRARMREDHTYYEGNVIGRFLELITLADKPEGSMGSTGDLELSAIEDMIQVQPDRGKLCDPFWRCNSSHAAIFDHERLNGPRGTQMDDAVDQRRRKDFGKRDT
ncbi:hypothetical protein GOC60_32520 [Sinorhizobium meliloti]|nr:hypothetical protein [Sinorhizobium meliloti]MDX0265782.1 hypothetical protein [Sinorhizobium meliloti]MDX0353222.1 hypothetical protein [Sinorhizobium meliloti]